PRAQAAPVQCPAMNPPRLLLHIGTSKTGSTAIQAALHERTRALAEACVTDVSQQDWAAASRAALGRLDQPDPILVQRTRAALQQQVEHAHRQGRRLLVWSYEGFAGNSLVGYRNAPRVAEALREITEGLCVTVAVYLRRQDLFLESVYAQQVFAGSSASFEAFANRYGAQDFDWHALLATYADAFGHDALRPRRYEPASLLDDFAEAVGVPLREPGQHPVRNPSCSALGIAALRASNDQLDRNQQKRFRAAIKALSPKPSGQSLVFFTAAQRREFIERYALSNALAAQRFFGTAEGDALFAPIEEPLLDAEPSVPDAHAVQRLIDKAQRQSSQSAWRTKLSSLMQRGQRLSRWDV
ncbi:MAG: hypothetical protein AAF663_12500, partial [Planctomycetota bacterium]